MDIRVLEQSTSNAPIPGGISLEVTLDFNDLAQLSDEARRALAIERAVPEEARSPLGRRVSPGNATDDAYIADFVETRATNDALEVRGIAPVAVPHVETTGLSSGSLYTCRVHVYPRPEIGLTSLEPVDLRTGRIPKPGFSTRAGREGDANVEYIDDEKTLRMLMVKRLDGELPEPAMRALEDEYTQKFERELAEHNIDLESYRLAHNLTEEQYALMMARNALADAHWSYVLDAVFAGCGFTITDNDLLAYFEEHFPGYAEQLLELHELRNDLWVHIEKVRRAKALDWLLENAIK